MCASVVFSQIIQCRSRIQEDTNCEIFHRDLETRKAADAFDTFAENLCHSDKMIRVSTLRILCHYEPLNSERKEMGTTEVSPTLDTNV